MSTYLDQYIMVASPLPKQMWQMENPYAPGYTTCVPGFYEKYEHLLINHKNNPVGTVGMLYDGMSTQYCWYGVVLAYKDGLRNPYDPLIFEGITANQLEQFESVIVSAYRKTLCFSPPIRPRLIFNNHYH